MPGVQLLARTGRETGAVAHWITVMGSVSSPPAGDVCLDCIVQSGTTLFGCFAACLTESFSTLCEGLRHWRKPGSRPTGAGSAQREGAGNARGPPKSLRGDQAKARVEVERGGRGRARTSRTAARRPVTGQRVVVLAQPGPAHGGHERVHDVVGRRGVAELAQRGHEQPRRGHPRRPPPAAEAVPARVEGRLADRHRRDPGAGAVAARVQELALDQRALDLRRDPGQRQRGPARTRSRRGSGARPRRQGPRTMPQPDPTSARAAPARFVAPGARSGRRGPAAPARRAR